MSIEFKAANPPASQGQLERVERDLGFVLPTEYRRFLESQNGGEAMRYSFEIPAASNASVVRTFLGVDRGEYDDLLREYRDFCRTNEIDWLLPIIDDPCGNYVTIGVNNGIRNGRVFFWDHELFNPEPDLDGVYEIARDFDEFLTKLKPSPIRLNTAADVDAGDVWIDPDFLREQREKGNIIEPPNA